MKLYFAVLCLLSSLLVGCGSPTHKLMPPIDYKNEVTFHVPKKAYLYWQDGEQYAEKLKSSYQNSGMVGALVYSVIDSQDRANNPSKYTFVYGKAQQAIFMTSLKDTLEKNRVFDEVELITDPKLVKAEDVLIGIDFELTRVKNAEIILDVKMRIKNNNRKFVKTYFVQNDPLGPFSRGSFKKQQINVSEKLMNRIMSGIEEWSRK